MLVYVIARYLNKSHARQATRRVRRRAGNAEWTAQLNTVDFTVDHEFEREKTTAVAYIVDSIMRAEVFQRLRRSSTLQVFTACTCDLHQLGARDALTVPKNRHPVLCALAFEFEDVRLVVTDVLKQLVPDWPLAVEAPAPQGFQADLPAEGNLTFGHHGVVHLLLLNR